MNSTALHAERILARVPLLRVAAGLPGLPGLIREVGTFGLIGLLNAVADTLLFTLLHAAAGIGPLSSKIVSGLVTIVVSYYANRRWTWPHRPGKAAHRRQLMQFAALSGTGLLIAEACLGISHYLLGMHSLLADNLSANVIGLGLGTVWRFIASRRWVFTADNEAPVAATRPAVARPDETADIGPFDSNWETVATDKVPLAESLTSADELMASSRN